MEAAGADPAGRQVIVDDCLMRLAGVVSPQPPPRWSHTQEDGHNYEMAYAPEVSSTCRVKSESGDWVTENWGMGTRALSARWVSRLGGPGRAWGGAGETRKSCGEGASSEGHPLAFLPGGGGTAPRNGALRAKNPSVPGVGINGAWPPPSSSWSRLPLRPEHRPSLPFGRCWTGTVVPNMNWKARRSPYSQNSDARSPPRQACLQPSLGHT